jgi:cell division septal protein FtsQ
MTALAVNTISLTPSAKVVSLATGDSQSFLRPDSYYEPIINKLLASSIWNRNKITLNTDQINHQLLSRFPEISSASVTVPLAGHQPTVYIQPAQPVLILAASNGSFVVDASGRALLNAASAAQPFKGLPTLTDQSSLNVSLDHQALPADNVKFIRVVLAELAAKQYQVASMVLPPASSELDVYPAGQPYFIKFNLQNNDARQQAGTFLALAVSLKQQNITPTQYIDVRVDGRAYYK